MKDKLMTLKKDELVKYLRLTVVPHRGPMEVIEVVKWMGNTKLGHDNIFEKAGIDDIIVVDDIMEIGEIMVIKP